MTAPDTLEGWFALHEMRRLDRRTWSALDEFHREKAIAEAIGLLTEAEGVDPEHGRSVTYWVIGHKADLLTIHLRPDISELHELERRFDGTLLAAHTDKVSSYFSVVEISRHGLPDGAIESVESSPYVQSRLYPEIPDHSHYVCFYPMSKRRGEQDNWYLLDSPERGDLMRSHGRTGRRYAGKVGQIVTGSMGLDDWEWGVTLFSDDPLQFKKLIYEMRFDEVSARYAEFGQFFVGQRVDDLGEWLR
jgi:hydrogen peroxide-dependent heme synthase